MRGSISRSARLIVAFHNVWHGIPAILTVLGYAWVIRGFIYFVFTRYGVEGDGASARRAWLAFCRCRDRDRCAGRFVVVFIQKQSRTVLKAIAFGNDERSTYVPLELGLIYLVSEILLTLARRSRSKT